MKRNNYEYPHPVLSQETKDFIDSRFEVNYICHSDNGSEISICLETILECDGLVKLVASGEAKVIARLSCNRTSFRKTYDLKASGETNIGIPKRMIAGDIAIQGMIVAAKNIDHYSLKEFNPEYFGSTEFNILKGFLLASEPGFEIKLTTILEKNMAGIVLVRGDKNTDEMSVYYPEIDEANPELMDYIMITLPDADYVNYGKLMTKKHLKNGTDRFLHASVILPAITEGITKLKFEEEEEEPSTSYKGTVWADSIYNALETHGISDLANCNKSSYQLANMLLGNAIRDALSNIVQKSTDWATIKEEDLNL